MKFVDLDEHFSNEAMVIAIGEDTAEYEPSGVWASLA